MPALFPSIVLILLALTIAYFAYLRKESAERVEQDGAPSPAPVPRPLETQQAHADGIRGSPGLGMQLARRVMRSAVPHYVAACVLLVLGALILHGGVRSRAVPELRLAVPSGGEYRSFMQALEGFANRGDRRADFRFSGQHVESRGSIHTIEQIATGQAELGVVQSNTSLKSNKTLSVAHVFPEYLLVLSRIGEDVDLGEWGSSRPPTPYRIACFGPGSQTYEDVRSILDFYGLRAHQDYALTSHGYDDAIDALLSCEVDAAIFIISKSSGMLSFLRNSDRRIQINGQEDLAALAHRLAPYRTCTIPEGHFFPGSPELPTISVQATLVCSRTLSDQAVRSLTKDVFEHRADLRARYPGLELERPTEKSSVLPLHAGAASYYERDQPSFVARHEGAMQIAIGAIGLCLALAELYRATLRGERIVLVHPRPAGDEGERGTADGVQRQAPSGAACER